MTDELSFEVYLSLSQKKFEIYLLDKKSLKNIYQEEVYLKSDTGLIDYNQLNSFLDKNIFKIEKIFQKNLSFSCFLGLKQFHSDCGHFEF